MTKHSPVVLSGGPVLTNRFFQVCLEPDDEGAGGAEPGFDFAQPSEALNVAGGAAMLAKSMRAERERAADGTFAKSEQQTEPVVDETSKVVDLKTGKPPEKAEQEPADEDDDMEFEFAPEEEGKEPVRRKLSELVEGFEKAARLEAELSDVRAQSAHVPAEYTTAVQETVQARGNYLKSLELVARMFNPEPPSADLMNPSHPKYDPEAYYAAYQQFERSRDTVAALRKEHEATQREQQEQTGALLRAHLARESQALHKAWPEIKDKATAAKVSQDLQKVYGFSAEEVANSSDHRMLLVVRDALKLRALEAKQAEAVKVVRQKPKLVKGAARTTTDSKAAGRTMAMRNLAQTGSVAHAAAALKGLI